MDDIPSPPITMKEAYADPLTSVGWFMPPFVQMGTISEVVRAIRTSGGAYDQDELERAMERVYCPVSLSSMVVRRYPLASVVQEYSLTIFEAVEAHILGLDHIAVSGLIPVVEGAGRQLAVQHGLDGDAGIKTVFATLTDTCKELAVTKQLGAVDEVVCMLDSFAVFTSGHLYERSDRYPLADKTNRHGIAHGAYADADYGRPLNFFKTIAAVDFLTFVSTFKHDGSWFAPGGTPRSLFLAEDWLAQRERRAARTGQPMPTIFADQLRELRALHPWLQSLPLDEEPPWR